MIYDRYNFKQYLTFKETIGLFFVLFANLDKKRVNLKIFDKMSIEMSANQKRMFENPFEILNMGLNEDDATLIDEKKDSLRKKIDTKVNKSLREVFFHYTKSKMNIDVTNVKEYDRMYEKDFLKFCKEYEFWLIVKSSNTKDINKNRE